MTTREMTAYQAACDHCGRTADDLGAIIRGGHRNA